MFKKGDKVRRVRVLSGFNPYYDGKPFILSVNPDGLWRDPDGEWHDEDNLELMINTEEQAKATLEALGYTVTPPKPKQVIEVVVYKSLKGGTLFNVSKSIYDNWSARAKTLYPIIAIATITEGDGL